MVMSEIIWKGFRFTACGLEFFFFFLIPLDLGILASEEALT